MTELSEKKVKYEPALIAIVIISCIGIIMYLFSAVMSAFTIKPKMIVLTLFPLIMSILMYVSIIRYTNDYFKKGKDVSVAGMMIRFCAFVAASTITVAGNNSGRILICSVMILVLAPLFRENFVNFKLAVITGIAVLILTAIMAFTKIAAGVAVVESGAVGMMNWASKLFSNINLFIQWAIFFSLYLIRYFNYDKEERERIAAENKKKPAR